MTNRVINVLTVQGDQSLMNACFASICSTTEGGDICHIDFEKIIPLPPHIFCGDLSEANEKRYGPNNCWRNWKVFNWGTKWNACDTLREDNVITFSTAWSMPDPIYRCLSAMYPGLEFGVRFGDPLMPNNSGSFLYQDRERLLAPGGGLQFGR